MHEIRFGSKTGSKNLCYFINVFLYLLSMVLSFFLVYRNYEFLIDLLYSALPYIFLIVTVVFIFTYAIELIFMKMNERWWYAFIPIYNIFVLSYHGLGSYWFGIIGLIPIVNIIYFLEKNHVWKAVGVAILTLFVKEDAAIYVAVIAFYFVLVLLLHKGYRH